MYSTVRTLEAGQNFDQMTGESIVGVTSLQSLLHLILSITKSLLLAFAKLHIQAK